MAAVQILKPDPADKHKFVLDEETLRDILVSRPDIRDRPVIVISVAGRYRTGKSFLLSLMHRFLSLSHNNEKNPVDSAAGHAEGDFWTSVQKLTKTGFDWKGGCDAHTVGLWLSREPFLVTLPSGIQANVFLLDTAGTFQTQASVRECGTVFGLATLVSSLLVYNIMNNVGEDDLQNLHLFAECGKMAAQKNTEQPFQKLLFLVRDWIDGRRFPFGAEGGQTFLKKVLDEEEGDQAPDEVRRVRHFLKSSFRDLDCFLLPRPGDEVADALSLQECNFDVVKPAFKENILGLIETILDPSNLIIKETIPGCSVTGQQMFLMFQRYLSAYNHALPEDILSSVVQITSMLQHEAAKSKAVSAFSESAKKVEVVLKKYDSMDELEAAFELHTASALDIFHTAPKIGDENITKRYLSELEEQISLASTPLKNEMRIIILVKTSKKKYNEGMKLIRDDLVSVDEETVLVQAHTKIHDRLINKFDEEEVSKTNCLEISMRYRSELIDWTNLQLQELNRTWKAHQTAVKFSVDKYRNHISQLKQDIDKLETIADFNKRLETSMKEALAVYEDFDKGGDEGISLSFKALLVENLGPESHEVEALMQHVLQFRSHVESHNKEITKLKLSLTETDSESLKKACCEAHLDTLNKFAQALSSLKGGNEMHIQYKERLDTLMNEQTNEVVDILETHIEAVDEAMKFLNKEIDYIQAAMGDYTENQFHTRTSFLSNDITKLFNKFKKQEDTVATIQFLDLLDFRIEERVETLILERKHIFKVLEAKGFYKQHSERVKYDLVRHEKEETLKSHHEEISRQTLSVYDTFMTDDVDLHSQYHAQIEKWLGEQLQELLLIRDSHRKAQSAALCFFIEAIKEVEASLDRRLGSFNELQLKLDRIQADAISRFKAADKRGKPDVADQYRKDMSQTIAVSAHMVMAKYQHISAQESSLEAFHAGMTRLQIRMKNFKNMDELESAYKAHEEEALTNFLSGCPEGDFENYSNRYSADLINEMTLAWNDISYEMQCLLAKRDGENFCSKAVESIKAQIKHIKTQPELEKQLRPMKEKTDLLYKGIEKAARTEQNAEAFNRYDTELENFIGDNIKQLGQCFKDHQLLKEAMIGATEKYRTLLAPVIKKRLIDMSDHSEDFAWAEKLALSAFDELAATSEIARDQEVPHDLKIEYMDELKNILNDESEVFKNLRYRTNFYNGIIGLCAIFLVSTTFFSLETIGSLLVVIACLAAGYFYVLSKQGAQQEEQEESVQSVQEDKTIASDNVKSTYAVKEHNNKDSVSIKPVHSVPENTKKADDSMKYVHEDKKKGGENIKERKMMPIELG